MQAGNSNADSPFWAGDWYVDPAAGRISRRGAEVRLEPKVMSVLVYLAQRPGEVISREALEEAVWPNVVVSYDALSGTIIKLRRALGDDSRKPHYLETISKKGYRLLVSVSDQAPMPDDEVSRPVVAAGSPGLLTNRVMQGLLLGLAGLLALLLITLLPDEGEQAGKSTGAKARPSLVVLPFVNLGNNPAQEYFSDGMTDDLINDLSGYASLDVVARRSAYIYKRRQQDVQAIAGELGVDYLLDGSVRRSEGMIRVNVQLIDAASGLNIWAQRFDEQVNDIFDVQDHIRKNIIQALSVTLTKQERERTRRQYTKSFEAYDLFLQGQAKLVTRASASDSQAAQALMEKAIRIDPDFARAHAALALIHADAYRFNWSDDQEQSRQLALEIGQRAIELDNKSPQAHWILGYIYLFCFEEHDKAIAMSSRSLELLADNPDAITMLAVTHVFGDDPQKGRLLMQELMQRNKNYSAMVPSVLGLANLRLGNYDEALAAYNKSLLINPSRVQGNTAKALVLYRMGNIDDAEFQVDELYSLHPDFDVEVWGKRQPYKEKSITRGFINDLVKAGAE